MPFSFWFNHKKFEGLPQDAVDLSQKALLHELRNNPNFSHQMLLDHIFMQWQRLEWDYRLLAQEEEELERKRQDLNKRRDELDERAKMISAWYQALSSVHVIDDNSEK